MKSKTLLILLFCLVNVISCNLFLRDQNMFDPSNLQAAFKAFLQRNGSDKLVEIEIGRYKLHLTPVRKSSYIQKFFLREIQFKYPSEWTDFRLAEVDITNRMKIDKNGK